MSHLALFVAKLSTGSFRSIPPTFVPKRVFGCASNGGRSWWAHFEFTRINIAPTLFDPARWHAPPEHQLRP